ncbi:uncharacterized protein LOC101888694 [Musca domestica]|uniref:Uncharacterized protein LOC101888694 n=1 Tax=Musca domestica TaxID=7370 RepID=A0A1I8MKK1_MUSDO|nr:uncharacterized protein LOC101888694 [Musca domestica]XP_058976159.1 uncharacterized protein LOC101888694 [Musca domestica]
MSDDSDYEEEEYLVFADFKNQILPKELSDENSAIKIIGIETKNPVAEINGNIFKGTYDFVMGTDVFFEKDDDAPPDDPLFEATCRQKFKVFGKTNKVINFERMYVESLRETDQQMGDAETEAATETPADENNMKLNMNYDEAIKQFPNVNDPQWKEKDLF